jgi:hypothetical protein
MKKPTQWPRNIGIQEEWRWQGHEEKPEEKNEPQKAKETRMQIKTRLPTKLEIRVESSMLTRRKIRWVILMTQATRVFQA